MSKTRKFTRKTSIRKRMQSRSSKWILSKLFWIPFDSRDHLM